MAENPEKFKVVALAAGSNVTLLADQVRMMQAYCNCKLNVDLCLYLL